MDLRTIPVANYVADGMGYDEIDPDTHIIVSHSTVPNVYNVTSTQGMMFSLYINDTYSAPVCQILYSGSTWTEPVIDRKYRCWIMRYDTIMVEFSDGRFCSHDIGSDYMDIILIGGRPAVHGYGGNGRSMEIYDYDAAADKLILIGKYINENDIYDSFTYNDETYTMRVVESKIILCRLQIVDRSPGSIPGYSGYVEFVDICVLDDLGFVPASVYTNNDKDADDHPERGKYVGIRIDSDGVLYSRVLDISRECVKKYSSAEYTHILKLNTSDMSSYMVKPNTYSLDFKLYTMLDVGPVVDGCFEIELVSHNTLFAPPVDKTRRRARWPSDIVVCAD